MCFIGLGGAQLSRVQKGTIHAFLGKQSQNTSVTRRSGGIAGFLRG